MTGRRPLGPIVPLPPLEPDDQLEPARQLEPDDHEFAEDVNDGSMCMCGIPAAVHRELREPDDPDPARIVLEWWLSSAAAQVVASPEEHIGRMFERLHSAGYVIAPVADLPVMTDDLPVMTDDPEPSDPTADRGQTSATSPPDPRRTTPVSVYTNRCSTDDPGRRRSRAVPAATGSAGADPARPTPPRARRRHPARRRRRRDPAPLRGRRAARPGREHRRDRARRPRARRRTGQARLAPCHAQP